MFTHLPSLLLATTTSLSVGGEVRELVVYELSRLGQFDEPRIFWAVLASLLAIAVVYVLWLYHRERGPLSRLLRLLLPGLRLLAIAGAVMFFLGLEKRVDKQIITDSVVTILPRNQQRSSQPRKGRSSLGSRFADARRLAAHQNAPAAARRLFVDVRRKNKASGSLATSTGRDRRNRFSRAAGNRLEGISPAPRHRDAVGRRNQGNAWPA